MKKIIIIVLISLVFTGCSKSTEELTDPIVGSWKLTSIVAIGMEFINSCKSKDSITIKSDKTVVLITHSEDANCAPVSGTGTWALTSTNNYTFTSGNESQVFILSDANTLITSFQIDPTNTIRFTYKKQ